MTTALYYLLWYDNDVDDNSSDDYDDGDNDIVVSIYVTLLLY